MRNLTVKNSTIILALFLTLTVTLTLGWLFGRTARDNALESIIRSQNEIISTYAYQMDDLQVELRKKVILIEAQRTMMKNNEKQINDIQTTQKRILRELKALKEEIKKQEQSKPFLPDNAIFLPDMVLY